MMVKTNRDNLLYIAIPLKLLRLLNAVHLIMVNAVKISTNLLINSLKFELGLIIKAKKKP